MRISGNALWFKESELENLMSLGLASGPIETKEISQSTIFRRATAVCCEEAERYAKEKGYEIIMMGQVNYSPENDRDATIRFRFYKFYPGNIPRSG